MTDSYRDIIKRGIELGQYPRYLYRYRSLSSAIRDLKEPSIYMNSITDFNDPYEGHFTLEAQNTQQEWMHFLMNNAKGKMSTQEMLIKSHSLSRNANNAKKILEPIIIEDLKDSGVCCFDKEEDNILMWAYYAEEHKGICIEYDPLEEEQLCEYLLPVTYSNNYLQFNYLRDPKKVTNSIAQKAQCWERENEVRLIKPNKAKTIIKISPKSIKSILFGCRFIENIKKDPKRDAEILELIDILKRPEFKHISLKECKLSNSQYQLLFSNIKLIDIENRLK